MPFSLAQKEKPKPLAPRRRIPGRTRRRTARHKNYGEREKERERWREFIFRILLRFSALWNIGFNETKIDGRKCLAFQPNIHSIQGGAKNAAKFSELSLNFPKLAD